MSPRVYLPISSKGGVGKSTNLSFVASLWLERGITPIIVRFDLNDQLDRLVDCEVRTGNLTDLSNVTQVMARALADAESTDAPVLIDLPARGGETRALDNLVRSSVLEDIETVGLVPLLSDETSFAGAIEAHGLINPTRTFMFPRIPIDGIKPTDFPAYDILIQRWGNVIEIPDLADDLYILRTSGVPIYKLRMPSNDASEKYLRKRLMRFWNQFSLEAKAKGLI